VVGRLIRARGNRGELVGEIYSSHPGRAEKLKQVVLESEGRQRPSEVESVWNHDGRPIFKFVGIDSISDAKAWAGSDILVLDSEQVTPDAGEYSHADLIGCRVMAGQSIGVVKGVEEYGGPPLLKIEALDGREILIPFAQSICKQIDVTSKVIHVELPEGLLDL
jgi:16S rRNA processing protein RimM